MAAYPADQAGARLDADWPGWQAPVVAASSAARRAAAGPDRWPAGRGVCPCSSASARF